MSHLNLGIRILVSLILLAAATVYKLNTSAAPAVTFVNPPALANSQAENPQKSFTVYFTNPESQAYDEEIPGGENPETILLAAIQAARLSIDLAIFDLSLPKIRQALIDANQRGVAVRLVTESDNIEHPDLQALQTAGLTVRGDNAAGLMHNKFLIIDRLDVWTGSMNLTYPGVYQENNNLVRVRSPELAQDYQAEFEAMYLYDCFGGGPATNDACSLAPFPPLQLGDTELEIFFSPGGGAATRLVDLINRAEDSIYFLAFSFTAEDIANAMLGRAKEGVIVSGVFEDSQVSSAIEVDSVYGLMRSAGLDVHLDGNPDNMHHKVIILDKNIVVIGSYNFSRSAETRNDENLLIIHDPQIAAQYLAEFQHVYQEAKP